MEELGIYSQIYLAYRIVLKYESAHRRSLELTNNSNIKKNYNRNRQKARGPYVGKRYLKINQSRASIRFI